MKQSIFEASEALKKWEGMILKKTMSFRWFSSNSEVEATWASMIGWPHKTSITYLYLLLIHNTQILYPTVLKPFFSWWVTFYDQSHALFFGRHEYKCQLKLLRRNSLALTFLFSASEATVMYLQFYDLFSKLLLKLS